MHTGQRNVYRTHAHRRRNEPSRRCIAARNSRIFLSARARAFPEDASRLTKSRQGFIETKPWRRVKQRPSTNSWAIVIQTNHEQGHCWCDEVHANITLILIQVEPFFWPGLDLVKVRRGQNKASVGELFFQWHHRVYATSFWLVEISWRHGDKFVSMAIFW